MTVNTRSHTALLILLLNANHFVFTSATTSQTTTTATSQLNATSSEESEQAAAIPAISLDDVFISVKTTDRMHNTRVEVILLTWFNQARNQTYFFTDDDDPILQFKTNNHAVNTQCQNGASADEMSCKMSKEFDFYRRTKKRWWCHVDDDTYVNVRLLLQVLRRYDWRERHYLGKYKRNREGAKQEHSVAFEAKIIKFSYGVGGAGVCVSKGLSDAIADELQGGLMRVLAQDIGSHTDDSTLGFAATYFGKTRLTEVDTLHSDQEKLSEIIDLRSQVTLGYLVPHNVVQISESEYFAIWRDPTRFFSIHCMNYPKYHLCTQIRK